MQRLLLTVLVLCLAGPAHAAKIPEQQWAAVRAAEVHGKHCADTNDDSIERAGSAIAAVGETYASLDGLPERTGATGLLYWRGLLAECLGFRSRATDDLLAFLEEHENDTTWVEPVRDAMRRLERMGVVLETGGASAPRPGAVAGVIGGASLGAGAGVLGALAGVRAQQRNDLEAIYYSGTVQSGEFASLDAQGIAAARDANGFLAGAVGLGVGAIATALIGGLIRPSRGSTTFALLPAFDGERATLWLAGRW